MATASNNSSRMEKERPASTVNGNAAAYAEENEESGGMLSTFGVRVVQTIIFVYDFVTFPFYLAYQRPWNATSAARAIRALPIEKTKDSITFQPIEKTCPEVEKFKVLRVFRTVDEQSFYSSLLPVYYYCNLPKN